MLPLNYFTSDLLTEMIKAVEPVLQHILEGLTQTASTHSHLDSCICLIIWDPPTFYNVIILFSQTRRVLFWICEDYLLSAWQVYFVSLRLSTICWRRLAGIFTRGSFYPQLWIWQSKSLYKNIHLNNLFREQVQWVDILYIQLSIDLC